MRMLAVMVLVAACGAAGSTAQAPPRGDYVDDLGRPPGDRERALIELVNAERAVRELPPLVWNGHLAAVAQRRSQQLRAACGEDRLATTADEKVEVVQSTTIVVANVARAETVDEAHRALMANPRQRAHVLAANLNQIGIGIDATADGVFVTELFIHKTPRIDRAAVAARVRDAVIAAKGLSHDADLAGIAAMFADGFAAGRTFDQLWPEIRVRIREIDRRFEKIGHVAIAVADLDALDPVALLAGLGGTVFGAGIAQGVHPELGSGAVWVVVVTGRRLGGL